MPNRLKTWSHALSQWLGLVAQGVCPVCRRLTSESVCLSCQHQIRQCQIQPPHQRLRASMSGHSAPPPDTRQTSRPRSQSSLWVDGDLPIFAWGQYQGALKRAIAALKYEHNPQLAVPLGSWMAQAWNSHPAVSRSAIVVPIPMHPKKHQQRGFNQAELLAESFCAVARLPLKAHGLSRIRETEAQFRLSGNARHANLKDAFYLGPGLTNRRPSQPIWLLDDIYTTGATAHSAAQLLRSHGFEVKGIIVLAMTRPDLKSPD